MIENVSGHIAHILSEEGTPESLVGRLKYYQEIEEVHPAIAFTRLLQQRGSEGIHYVFHNFVPFLGPKRTVAAAYEIAEKDEGFGKLFHESHALLVLGIAWEGMLDAILYKDGFIDTESMARLYNEAVTGTGMPRRPEVVGAEQLFLSLDAAFGKLTNDLTGSFLFDENTLPRAMSEFFYQTGTGVDVANLLPHIVPIGQGALRLMKERK